MRGKDCPRWDECEGFRTTSRPSFDSPHDAVQENGTYGGDEGKAVGRAAGGFAV